MTDVISLASAFDTYALREQRGQGGTGVVYRAEDSDGHVVAVKVLRPGLSTKQRKRFQNELSFCYRMVHPNIVKVTDWGTNHQGSPFYVMPFYAETLRDLMSKGIPKDQIASYFVQMLEAVDTAHRRDVWHRDLKPENFLYDRGSNRLLLADFGIAHFSEDELRTLVETRDQERLANFQYAAPEQRRPGETVGPTADIYALGMILYEMFTGRLFQGTEPSPIDVKGGQYAYLQPLVEWMTRQDSSARPSSAAEVRADLLRREAAYRSESEAQVLRKQTVPSTEINDSLILDPPTIINWDWRKGRVFFKLSRPVTDEWMGIFKEVNGSGFSNHTGEDFEYRNQELSVEGVGEQQLQRLVDYGVEYVRRTNSEYKAKKERQAESRRLAEMKELEHRSAEAEQRSRILSTVRLRSTS